MEAVRGKGAGRGRKGCESAKAESRGSLELYCFVCFAVRRSRRTCGGAALRNECASLACSLDRFPSWFPTSQLASVLQKNQLSDAKLIC